MLLLSAFGWFPVLFLFDSSVPFDRQSWSLLPSWSPFVPCLLGQHSLLVFFPTSLFSFGGSSLLFWRQVPQVRPWPTCVSMLIFDHLTQCHGFSCHVYADAFWTYIPASVSALNPRPTYWSILAISFSMSNSPPKVNNFRNTNFYLAANRLLFQMPHRLMRSSSFLVVQSFESPFTTLLV